MTANRWVAGDVPRGADYDRRFEELAAQGHDMHGEAALVDAFGPGSVLDAGCGTGRVAIELHRRGHPVVGVDSDPAQPLALGRRFDTVLLAGNVLIFVAPGTEGAVIANLAGLLVPGGRLVAGYSLRPDRLDVPTHNALAASAGLELEDRWSTWDRAPLGGGSSYTVSVHRRPG